MMRFALLKPLSTPVQLAPGRNNFDLIRVALALLVLFSHSFPLATGNELTEPMKRLTGKLTFGELAVDGFFVLSGFLITHSFFNSRRWTEFMRRRVLRIYPGFIVAGLLTLFLFGFAGAGFDHAYFARLSLPSLLIQLATLHVPNLGGLTGVPYGITINGSLWTIPFEFCCYLGVAILGSAALLRRPAAILVLFLLALTWYAYQEHYHLQYPPTSWARVLGADAWARLASYFLAGVLFYVFYPVIPKRPLAIACCSLLVLVALVAGKGIHLVMPVCGAYLLLMVGLAGRIPTPHFFYLGKVDLSYGIYLYAFPLQQLIMRSFGHQVAPLTLFFCALPPLILVALGSWFCVERPFLRLKGKRPMITSQPPRKPVLAPVNVIPATTPFAVTNISSPSQASSQSL